MSSPLKQRTEQQNKAAHKGFEILADALNASGKDMRVVLKPDINIPWTKNSVKEYLFKPILKAMFGKDHTADMEKNGEIEAVWETMMRFLMEKHYIEYIPFPSMPPGYADTAPLKSDYPHSKKS